MNLNNIKQLCMQSMLYAQDRKNRFPESMEKLRDAWPSAKPDVFHSLHGDGTEYIIIPGLKLTSPGSMVLIYDPNVDAQGGMAVGFVDTTVEVLPADEAMNAIDETRRRLKQN